MKFIIKHEIRGRMRIHVVQKRMTYSDADTLQYYLENLPYVISAKVQDKTQNVVIYFEGSREWVINALKQYDYLQVEVPEYVVQSSGRELNAKYWEQLVNKLVLRAGSKLFVPYPLRIAFTLVKACKYIRQGIRVLGQRKIEVAVLDATAIAVSLVRRDFKTASSIMFLLSVGEILEEWTHKKSVNDLARSMSINISKVWLVRDDQETLIAISQIKPGDLVVVHVGNTIPFDGIVMSGEAMVNQASLTGESIPVRKVEGSYVYAGTVIEEGEIRLQVKEANGSTKYEKIVTMIEDSEKLKSTLESKAEHLADKLVPYTLFGAGLTWLLTRNVTKAVSVLMVDYSCALKLAMPITVLSAIRELREYHVVVKGGKFLEAMAEADTIVFDKTGTLTKAEPTVVDVVSFCQESPDELLRVAACMEEHFPHSMAKAVVDAARQKGLEHEEMHSKVEYIVAHGISTTIEGRKTIIGSYHFVFEDEGCILSEGMEEKFKALPAEYSHLYLAIEGILTAVICIEDPLREEAADAIRGLKAMGIKKIVMMTGDSKRVARSIAEKVGLDEYYYEVLPEDKARFVEQEKAARRKVVMIGDGINDSPALSAADVGIAIRDGAELAQQIADVTIAGSDLYELLTLKKVSDALMRRIRRNYRSIVGINTGLIGLGVTGVLQPTTSAFLHNTSTLAISLKSMEKLI